MSSELAHYGVKGMRWGVRKDRLNRSEKRKFKGSDRIALERRKEFWFDQSITDQTYKSLSTKSETMRRGQEVYRVSARKDEKLQDLSYFSNNTQDRINYRVIMPQTHGPRVKQYEYVFETTKKLQGPSEKERFDAFVKLMDTPNVTINNRKGDKNVTGREYLKTLGYGKQLDSLTSHQLGLNFYRSFSQDIINGTPLTKAYVSEFSKKGYGFIGDDFDSGVVSKSPVIILNPNNGSIRSMSVQQLTSKDLNDAKRNLVLPEDHKWARNAENSRTREAKYRQKYNM